MHSRIRRQLDRALNAQDFHRADPITGLAGHTAQSRLAAALARGDELAARERAAEAEGEQLARERTKVAAPLREQAEQLAQFLRLVAAGEGKPALHCRTPRYRPRAIGAWLRDVRALLPLANDHTVLLARYGLPIGLVGVLTDRLNVVEDLHRRRLAATATATEVTQELLRLTAELSVVLRHLDALNRLRFATAPGRLTEWRAALATPRTVVPPPPSPTTRDPVPLTS